MFWSKSKEKQAPDPAPEPQPEPEPSDPNTTASEPSNVAPAAKNASTPQDEDETSKPSGSSWGSRLNTAKQLYGTANQVYTVAQAVPQAKAALEPYLAKASTTEDSTSETEKIAAEPTDSTQESAEVQDLSSDHKSAPDVVDDATGSEAPTQPQEESSIQDKATSLSSEPTPEEENINADTSVKDTPASQDAHASKPVSIPANDDQTPAASSNPSALEPLEAEPTKPSTDTTSALAQPEEDSSSLDVSSKDKSGSRDTTSLAVRSGPTSEDEAQDVSEKSSAGEENIVEDSSHEDAASKDTPAERDTSAIHSSANVEDEMSSTNEEDLGSAEDNVAEDLPSNDAFSKEEPAHSDLPVVHSGTEDGDEAAITSDKTLDQKDDSLSTSRDASSADELASETLKHVNEESKAQIESSPGKSVPKVEAPAELSKDKEPETVNQIQSSSASKSDLTPLSDPDTGNTSQSKLVSAPVNDSAGATDTHTVSPALQTASTPDPESTSAKMASSEPDRTEDTSSGSVEPVSAAEQTFQPANDDSQAVSDPKPADEPAPGPETAQPTPEEIERAAEAAKSAARLQSTADTLRAQARAIRDPAERERLWRAAYDKEVEAHGQSKKARAMASGWGQGVLSGVGVSAAVGIGLGNVVGALLGGVVSVPGTLIGAGVGAAMGPLVKLGGYGKKEEKPEDQEKPKEFDWEEDLSDDEEHRKLVDAVRMDEATTEAQAEETS